MVDASMKVQVYDDPAFEKRWCDERRIIVADYLDSQRVDHGRIGDEPAWCVAPFASIWAIESVERPEWIGWWVICGDFPTDYYPGKHSRHTSNTGKAQEFRQEIVCLGAHIVCRGNMPLM
jgi:hypothetical protein